MDDIFAGGRHPSGDDLAVPRRTDPAPFRSRMSPAADASLPKAPDYARDLNLDQIVAAITAGHESLDLEPLYYTRLRDSDGIVYRHDVMRDLEKPEIIARLRRFLSAIREVHEGLAIAAKLYHPRQKDRVFVDAVLRYVAEIEALAKDLTSLPLDSRGLRGVAGHLAALAASSELRALREGGERVKADLSAIRYSIAIHGDTVTVRAYDDEADYSAEVTATFARFRQDAAKDYRVNYPDERSMNSVEERILDRLAGLFPEPFSALARYAEQNRDFFDPIIDRCFRELHFYLLYLDFIAPLRAAGLPFCYPAVSTRDKRCFFRDTFDLALAAKLVKENTPVVTNNVFLRGQERIFVVSGPNQGGKTTFVRTFGQLHHLAALGLPIPGRKARLFLPDAIHAHFEREETVVSLRGKLEDDLIRIHDILTAATPDSLILMNEIFSSTTLADAVFLATRIMERIIALDCLAVCVTFMDELASLAPRVVVSMISTVVPEDPARRTLKVVRRPADGKAYAWSIAEKYRLTRAWLDRRLAP